MKYCHLLLQRQTTLSLKLHLSQYPYLGDHSAKYSNITVEDTTFSTSTALKTGNCVKEGPDDTTPSDKKEVDHPSPDTTRPITPLKGRKRPLSPSVTNNGPNQKTRKTENQIAGKSKYQKRTEEKKPLPHYRPPPLLRLRVKPTPALAERLTQSGYLPLKKRTYPRKNR